MAGGLDPYTSIIIGFVTAVLAGIAIRMIIDYILRPILVIDVNDKSVIIRRFELHPSRFPRPGQSDDVSYLANRITVKNTGKSAARDYKAYFDYEEYTQRVAWLLADKNSGFTIIINVKDREFVDLCAIREDNAFRIIPPEQGYVIEYEDDYATQVSSDEGMIELTLRITSSNAKPIEIKVKLHNRVDHFPDQYGRIVGFLDENPQPLQPQGFEDT